MGVVAKDKKILKKIVKKEKKIVKKAKKKAKKIKKKAVKKAVKKAKKKAIKKVLKKVAKMEKKGGVKTVRVSDRTAVMAAEAQTHFVNAERRIDSIFDKIHGFKGGAAKGTKAQ